MGAITGTKVVDTEMPGEYKIATITCTPGTASDTVAISLASHGISAVYAILGATITAGADANLQEVQVTRTSTTSLTVVTKNAAGTNATDWTSASITIAVLGK